MENTTKNKYIWIGIPILIMLILLLIVVIRQNQFKDPEQLVKEKHASNPSYEIEKSVKKDNYVVFLCQDKANVYLDIYAEGKHFGGTGFEVGINRNLWVYQFQQYETLPIVYGINPEHIYKDYELTIASDTHEPLIIHEDCSKEQYILNVYVLDNKYNHTADLKLNGQYPLIHSSLVASGGYG